MKDSVPTAVLHMSEHVLSHLSLHKARHALPSPPLFVGIQGPQGSGKTYLSSQLRTILASDPHFLSVVVLSIDDLYLAHTGLVELAEHHPQNGLLKGRGQPGTHDVPLGTFILSNLYRINDGDGVAQVMLPVFDKSLFNGEGDRLPELEGIQVSPPIDVVLLEGWCVGFSPITTEELDRRWDKPVPDIEDMFSLKQFRKEDIVEVNEMLKGYTQWWSFFDVFIQIAPPPDFPHAYIYKWRLQQEHAMKARNGGRGMSDEQVKAFVDRYIPGYVFFGDGVLVGAPSEFVEHENDVDYHESGSRTEPTWKGAGLRIIIDEQREVMSVEHF